MKYIKSIQNNLFLIIFFSLLNFLFFHKLFWNNYYINGDIRDFIVQISYLKKQNINWNNYQFCGYPINFSYTGLKYIFSFDFFDIFTSIKISFIFHFIIFNFFVYKFLKLYIKNNYAVLIGSIIFTYSGYNINLLIKGHNTFIYTNCWGIVLLFLIINYLRKKKIINLVLIPITISLQISAGNLYLIIFNLLLIFFFIIYEIIFYENKSTNLIIHLILIIIILLISFILNKSKIIEQKEELENSIKKLGYTFNEAKRYSYSFSHLINIFMPDFYGSTIKENFWDNSFEDISLFITILGLQIVIYSLPIIFKKIKNLILLLLSLFFLLLTMGDIFPLFKILYYNIPYFKLFRAPVRFVFFYYFFIIFLISNLLDEIYNNKQVSKFFQKIIILFSITFLLILLINKFEVSKLFKYFKIQKILFFINKVNQNFVIVKFALIKFLIFNIIYSLLFFLKIDKKFLKIIIIFLFLELFLIYQNSVFIKIDKDKILNNSLYKKIKEIAENNRVYFTYNYRTINDTLFYKIKSLNGYSPSLPYNFVEFVNINKKNYNFFYEKLSNRIINLSIDSNIFNMLNAKYIISNTLLDNSKLKLIEIIENKYYIYENTEAWNFIEVFNKFYITNENNINKILIEENPKSKKLFLIKNPNLEINDDELNYKINDYNEYSENNKFCISFKIDINNNSLIFLPIMFDEKFKVIINGEKTDIYKANKLFLSFKVFKGKNIIKIIYN
ncbi:MAG TPA: YfhO family protein [bacterium]|nr:YfhO family protein [bacterium]HPQ19478.1 YfhO family protein [bacterium]